IGGINNSRRATLVGIDVYCERINAASPRVLCWISERKVVRSRHTRNPGISVVIDHNALRIVKAGPADIRGKKQCVSRWIQFEEKRMVAACVYRLKRILRRKVSRIRCTHDICIARGVDGKSEPAVVT